MNSCIQNTSVDEIDNCTIKLSNFSFELSPFLSMFEGSLIIPTSINYFETNVHTLCILHGKVAKHNHWYFL